MIELKSCPFCNGPAQLTMMRQSIGDNGEFVADHKVGCEKCRVSITRESILDFRTGKIRFIKDGVSEAVCLWNTRIGGQHDRA